MMTMMNPLTWPRALGVAAIAVLVASPASRAEDSSESNRNQTLSEMQSSTDGTPIGTQGSQQAGQPSQQQGGRAEPSKNAEAARRDQKLSEMQASTDGTPQGDSFGQPKEAPVQQAGQAEVGVSPAMSQEAMDRDRTLSVMQANTDGTPQGGSFSQPKEVYANAPRNNPNLADESVPGTLATDRTETRRQILAQNQAAQGSESIQTSSAAPAREQSGQTQAPPPRVARAPVDPAIAQSLSSHVILLESALHSALVQAQGLQAQLREAGSLKESPGSQRSVLNAGATELVADLDAADVQKGELSAAAGPHSEVVKSGEFKKLEQSYRDLVPVELSWRDRAVRPGYWKDRSSVSQDLVQLSSRIQNVLNATRDFSVAKLDIQPTQGMAGTAPPAH